MIFKTRKILRETNPCFPIFLAVLSAGAPQMAPFMADECLLAMPDVDSLDYTMKEYMRFVEYVKACVDRLNGEGKKILNFFARLPIFT